MNKSVFKFLGVTILEWEEWDELNEGKFVYMK